MTIDKTQLPSTGSSKSILAQLGFAAATLTSAFAYKHGVVNVFEFGLSNATTVFLKVTSNGTLEIGGTLEMGTGTQVKW
jgi:LPXTG-motif cell wall-anchored protein